MTFVRRDHYKRSFPQATGPILELATFSFLKTFQISLIFWFVSLLLTAKSDYPRGRGAENA